MLADFGISKIKDKGYKSSTTSRSRTEPWRPPVTVKEKISGHMDVYL